MAQNVQGVSILVKVDFNTDNKTFLLSILGGFLTKFLKKTHFWKAVKILKVHFFKDSPNMFPWLHKAQILNLSSPLDGLLHAENRLLLSFFIVEKSGFDF